MNRQALSARQIQHRRKVHAKGRKHFILYTGVLRFGGLMFVSMVLWEWHGKFNWQIPSATSGLFIDTSFILLVSMAMGYSWGKVMWDGIYSKTE